MESAPRYEIVDTIASGEFATVYRARDRELGREVAIKQIHEQFLSNPRQLDRYWREAQLLASLQHPNILTVYDVVRSKGWLILELMRGSLQRSAQTAPIDLDLLRIVLICSLNALDFLHTNGVIHGDVKPSNMLVDSQGRIKLGDFGLARRASNEQGSLLKGTTKYMAPELVSDQFGPIGPASDLYSLGFSAYELMCGPHFESLFPGLATFGRDRQIAWLMWHAAPDRQLPQIARVLEGVPEDLARVVERLVAKDQSRRYASAQEALQDLRGGRAAMGAVAPGQPAEPSPDKRKKTLRIGALAALAFSVVLSAILLFRGDSAPGPGGESQPVQAVVRSVDPDRRILILESAAGGEPIELHLKPDDRFFINDNKSLFRELQPADRVTVTYVRDESGRRIAEIHATRPETLEGRIRVVEPDAGRITVAYGSGGDQLAVRVPGTVKILWNGSDQIDGRPVALGDLHAGDRVTVQHVAEESGRAATALAALHPVTLEGTIRAVDAAKGVLTVEEGSGKDVKMVSLPLAPDCRVTLNDRTRLDERLLTAGDLRPGDRAKITRDTRVVSVEAVRILGQAGKVQAVRPKMLDVLLDGEPRPKTFLVDAECKIALGGEPAELEDLRPGDVVDLAHDSPSPRAPNPRALAVTARRPADPTRWAVLVAIEKYDDSSLGAVPYAAADAALLRDTLVARYGVPADHVLWLTDVSQVRLEREIPSFLEKLQAADRLIVYFSARAFRDGEGKVYLAAKEFHRERAAATGLDVQWLVDKLEACPAKDKLLLLDACHAVPGIDPQQEPSTAEMFQGLKAPAGQAPLRTLTGIASCSAGQRGHVLPERKHGLFAQSLAEGLSGRADKNRDGRLEATELFAFLTESMAVSAGTIRQSQTAKLFLPDNKPPRLSEEARKAIRELAVLVRRSEIKLSEAQVKYTAAQGLAEKEVEPKLLYGLILLKARQRADAERQFEDLRIERPALLLPNQALAWLRFDRRDYGDGIRDLTELVGKIGPAKKPGEAYPAEAQQLFSWVGQLREFAADADERRSVPTSAFQRLDAAAAAHGSAAAQLYDKGREQVRGLLGDFDAKIAAAPSEAVKVRLGIDRRQVGNFVAFPFEAAVQGILDGLDR